MNFSELLDDQMVVLGIGSLAIAAVGLLVLWIASRRFDRNYRR